MSPLDNRAAVGRSLARPIAIAAVVVALVLLLVTFQITGGLGATVDLIRNMASQSEEPLIRVVVYLVAASFTFLTVFLPLPAEAAALLNGTLFAPMVAFTLTWSFGMAGAVASYEIGRRYGRDPAGRLLGTTRLRKVERLVEKAGWPTLLALRLSPITAFTAINWASGILGLSRRVFLWTTALGLIPGTYVFSVVPGWLEREGSANILLVGALGTVAVLLAISLFRFRPGRQGEPDLTSDKRL